MKNDKIHINVIDNTEIEIIKYQGLSGSSKSAHVDLAIGPIIIRGVYVNDNREIGGDCCAEFPPDIVMSKELEDLLRQLVLFTHIVQDCRKATLAELKSGAAYTELD